MSKGSWGRLWRYTLSLLLLWASPVTMAAQPPDWGQFWNDYQKVFLDSQGRVIDWAEGGVTTSEGQSYALFFALVANQPRVFAKILDWTENNLAHGQLSDRLPAWRWGKRPDGSWGILSDNHAADSDLWIAYDLLQAGRLWKNPQYSALGKALAEHVAKDEVQVMRGAGPMLVPGEKYFRLGSTLVINPSYLPPFLLASLAEMIPDGPWSAMLQHLPGVLRRVSPFGFTPDWVAYDPDRGYFPAPQGVDGSYNAIRVYLWAGMTNLKTAEAKKIIRALWGMAMYLHSNDLPPLKEDYQTGQAEGNGPSGFSAAVIPLLYRYHMNSEIQTQLIRLSAEHNPDTGLYGHPPVHYYNQNLALFALGWYSHQFHFGRYGNVHPAWAGPFGVNKNPG